MSCLTAILQFFLNHVSINTYKCIYNYVVLSDLPYLTADNVAFSSSLTPADLSGFDIIISWNVSYDSVMSCYICTS